MCLLIVRKTACGLLVMRIAAGGFYESNSLFIAVFALFCAETSRIRSIPAESWPPLRDGDSC